MTKIYYDTEFVDTGREILPISIGMVKETGEELYLVNDNPTVMRITVNDEWLRENVLPSLPVWTARTASLDLEGGEMGEFRWTFEWNTDHPDFPAVGDTDRMMREVRRFVLSTPKPELWAWYGAYDHVFIAQLFGRMHDLPGAFPMITFDLKQEHVRLGSPRLSRQAQGQHNALADARHNVQMAKELKAWELNPARFGPLAPILPVPVDTPLGTADPRHFEYPVGGLCVPDAG